MELNSVDRLVRGEMHIGGIIAEIQRVEVRDVIVIGAFAVVREISRSNQIGGF